MKASRSIVMFKLLLFCILLTLLEFVAGDDDVVEAFPPIGLSLVSSHPSYTADNTNAAFPATNVLIDKVCDEWAGDPSLVTNYLLFNSVETNQTLTLELDEMAVVTEVGIRNTHNSYHNDRGTKDLLIETSVDNVVWTAYTNGTLASVYGQCPIPKIYFNPTTEQMPAKYLRITCVDFYGYGSGLQSVQVRGQRLP